MVGSAAIAGPGADWVAGAVRARLLSRRRLGGAGARHVAQQPSLDDALRALATSPYARAVREGLTLAEAQRAVAASTLRYLRFIAGWLPPSGGSLVHDLAGWWELENIEAHVAGLEGAAVTRPFELGTLGEAWPRAASTRSLTELRAALTASSWGDPGGGAPEDVLITLRLRLGTRMTRHGERARRWAMARAFLAAAMTRFVDGRRLPQPATHALRALGIAWDDSASFAAIAARQSRSLAWLIDGIDDPADLWRGEVRWWRRLESDAAQALRGGLASAEVVLGAVALLGVDAWRTKAALALAARGGRPVEAFDAVV